MWEDGICPAERFASPSTIARLWEEGPTTPLGNLALLAALIAWGAGLVDAARRRRWAWFAAIVVLNVAAVAVYALVRRGERR